MEIKYLKEFVTLAKELNYSSAAEMLFISQPVLSRHIMSLEKDLGMKLFDRTSKAVSLTKFGKFYLPYAEELARQFEKTEIKCRDYIQKSKSVIRIGSVENLQLFDVDKVLIGFRQMYPKYSFEITEASNNRLQEMFEDHRINLFTTCLRDGEDAPYEFAPIATDCMYAYICLSNPLSERKYINIKCLSSEQLFLPPQGTRFLSMIDGLLKAAGISPSTPFYGSYEAAKKFAEADMGIAIVPGEVLANGVPNGVKAFKLSPEIKYHRGIGYRKKGLSTAEKVFVEYALHYNYLRNK